MNIADRLSYLANTARFPFFGGWVAPSGSNPTTTVNGVVMDQIAGAPTGDQWLRAYYRNVQGNSCDVAAVDLYAQAIGLSGEVCYLRYPSKVPLVGVGLISEYLGDPAPALAIYGALLAAEASDNATVKGLAMTFGPLLSPDGVGIDVTKQATIVGLGYVVAAGVLTQDQANLIINLPLPSFA